MAGLLFALGLGLSGMTDARKVIGFLDLTGALATCSSTKSGSRRTTSPSTI
jgi:hypothetical protein